MTKTIMFSILPGESVHKLWKNFLLQPPKGYRYVNAANEEITKHSLEKAGSSSLLTKLYHLKRNVPWLHHLHTRWNEKRLSRKMDSFEPDLIYCINGRLYHGEQPWVVDFETSHVFFGYNYRAMMKYKDYVRAILERKSCKALLAYAETGKKSMRYFGKKVEKKTVIAPNVVSPPDDPAPRKHEGFRILLTGSSNITDNFYARGGKEVVRAFLSFSKQHDDVQLVMRCAVPDKEGEILEGTNAEIHEGLLPWDEFQNLFLQSDVYLFPAKVGYGLTLLEAMSYGLPVITSNLLENADHIEDGKEGITVEPEEVNFLLPELPDYYFTEEFDTPVDERYVDRIVAALDKLYNDKNLRRKMGKSARAKILKNHTIEMKNKILSDVYKKALS